MKLVKKGLTIMTKREAYEFVIANVQNQEVIDLFQKELASIDLKNAKAKEKRMEKANEDAPLVAQVAEVFANGERLTAGIVAERIGVSTSKAVVLMKKAGAVKLGEAKVNGKKSTVWGIATE